MTDDQSAWAAGGRRTSSPLLSSPFYTRPRERRERRHEGSAIGDPDLLTMPATALITNAAKGEAGSGGGARGRVAAASGAESQRGHMRRGRTCQLTARPRRGWGRLCPGWGAVQGLPSPQTLPPEEAEKRAGPSRGGVDALAALLPRCRAGQSHHRVTSHRRPSRRTSPPSLSHHTQEPPRALPDGAPAALPQSSPSPDTASPTL